VRADDGRCVYHTYCPKMQEDFFHRCHDNKIWHMCSGCEASCEDPQPECPQICLEARCECPRELGFAIRDDGKCVPREMCAPDQAAGKSFHHPPPPPDPLHPFGPGPVRHLPPLGPGPVQGVGPRSRMLVPPPVETQPLPVGPGPVRHQLPLGPGPVHQHGHSEESQSHEVIGGPGPVRHQLPLGPGPVQGVGPRSRMLVPPPVEPQPVPVGPGPVRHQLPVGPGPAHQHGHSEESQSHELTGGQRPLPQRRPRDKFQPPPPPPAADDHPALGPGPVRPIVPAPGPVVPPRPNVVGGQRPLPVIGPKS